MFAVGQQVRLFNAQGFSSAHPQGGLYVIKRKCSTGCHYILERPDTGATITLRGEELQERIVLAAKSIKRKLPVWF